MRGGSASVLCVLCMTVAGVSASTVQPACLMVMGSGAGVEPPRLPPTCVRAYVANSVCYMFACGGAAHVEWALSCCI